MKPVRSVRHSVRRWALPAAAVAAATALALSGCSASPKPTATPSSGVVTPVSLTLAMAAPSAGQPCVFYAEESGVYKALGLDLTISPQGSTEPALAAAGNFVIGANTITQAYPSLQAGRKVVQVISQTLGNPSDAITVHAGSQFKTLMDLSGQTVGVVGTSGYSYAGGVLYSKYIVQHGGKPLNLVVQPDQNTLTANLINQKIAAAVFPPVFGAAIAQGILKQILSAKSKLSLSLNGKGTINSTFWGLASTISANKTAVTRLVAGCRIAQQLMSKETATQISKVLEKNSNFAPAVIPFDQLVDQVQESYIGFEPTNQGYITKTGWTNSLKAWITIGIKNNGVAYSLNAPGFSYSDGVDMSYWNAATPSVNAYLKAHKK